MPTILDQLSAGLDTGPLDLTISVQAGQLGSIATLVAGLVDSPPGSVGDFATRLAALQVPALPDGRAATGALAQARATLPDFSSASAGALSRIADFSTLITTRLLPVLQSTVVVARSVEALTGAEFRCPPAPAGPDAPPPEPAPPVPPGSPGAGRVTVVRERVAEVDTLLAALPDPLTATSLIEWAIAFIRSDDLIRPAIPIFDDVLQPLDTLARWSAMTEAELGTNLRDSLVALRDRVRAAAPERLAAAFAPVTALATPLRATELAGFATAYLAAGQAMATALQASDIAAAAASAVNLETVIAGFEPLRDLMAADFTARTPGVTRDLAAVPENIFDALLHLATRLEPVNAGAFIAGFALPEPAPASAAEELQATFEPMIDFLEDLAGRLDFSSIEGEVANVATEAREIADAVNAALADVVRDIRAAFAEVEAAVTGIGLEQLATEMRTGIAAAGDELRASIGDGFAPLRNELSTAVQALSDAVDALDFTAIEAALRDVIDAIAGILQDPAISGAIEEIRALLDEAATTLRQLSFAPVTDEVIELIEEMTQGLRALAETDLNDAVKGALSVALTVLPPDLEPVTEPLIVDFGVAIDQGPVVLLEQIRTKPQEVLDRIRAFDPGAVVGDALSGPFQDVVGKLEDFRPSALMTPLKAALDAQKSRLKAEAKPSVALRPLANAFDELLAQIDRLSPATLIAPIEEAAEQAIRDAIEASPVDEIFAEINGVFATIESVLGMAEAIGATLRRLTAALQSLANYDAEIDAWRDGILAKVGAVPNAAEVTAAMAEVAGAFDASRHADLLGQFDAAVAPLLAELTPLAPGARLSQIAILHQQLRQRVSLVAAGPERTAMQAALDRFDPLDPADAGGLSAAGEFQRGLAAARSALVDLEPLFTEVLHGPDGALRTAMGTATNAAALAGVLSSEIELALGPVRHLLARLAVAAVPTVALASTFEGLHARVTGALANILTGPASLQTISQAVQGVVDTLRRVDFGVLRESIDGVFRTVRGQIEALGPTPLLLDLDREFGSVIDAIDLDAIVPKADVAALDSSYETVLERLRLLDPEDLVTKLVNPVFEEEIVPLVEALDLTPVFDALIAALRDLDEQLKSELGRVNTAYQTLLAARPGGGASVSIGF